MSRGPICNLDQVQKSPPPKKTHTIPQSPHHTPTQKKNSQKFHNSTQTNNLKATYTELPMDSKNSLVFFSPTPFEQKYAHVKMASKSSPILGVNIKKIVEIMTFPEKVLSLLFAWLFA